MFSRLYGVLLPFLVSLLLAYMLAPIVDFLQVKCRLRYRWLAVTVTLLLVVLLLVLAIGLLVPALAKEVSSAMVGIEQYLAGIDINQYLSEAQQEKLKTITESLNMEALLSFPEVQEALRNILPTIGSWISSGLSWLAELVVVFICMMYLIFLLIDLPSIRANWSKSIPKKYRAKVVTLVHDMDRNMSAYFRGQAMVAGCVGILFAIGFLIIGLPMAIAMGLIIGVLNMIPYMQALAIPPCILLSLVQSAQTGEPVWLTILLMAVVFIVVQTTQDMLLTPKIMGKVTGMGPTAILLSLSIWGALFGFLGMIIALPMTTLIISYYKHYVLGETE